MTDKDAIKRAWDSGYAAGKQAGRDERKAEIHSCDDWQACTICNSMITSMSEKIATLEKENEEIRVVDADFHGRFQNMQKENVRLRDKLNALSEDLKKRCYFFGEDAPNQACGKRGCEMCMLAKKALETCDCGSSLEQRKKECGVETK